MSGGFRGWVSAIERSDLGRVAPDFALSKRQVLAKATVPKPDCEWRILVDRCRKAVGHSGH